MKTPPAFDVALRGYDRDEVAALVIQIDEALESTDPAVRARAGRALDEAAFSITFRGYDRTQVQTYLAEARADLGRPLQ